MIEKLIRGAGPHTAVLLFLAAMVCLVAAASTFGLWPGLVAAGVAFLLTEYRVGSDLRGTP